MTGPRTLRRLASARSWAELPSPSGPDRLPILMGTLLRNRIAMQGFISAWVAEGAVKCREDVVDGLENGPAALIGLLAGRNFGKVRGSRCRSLRRATRARVGVDRPSSFSSRPKPLLSNALANDNMSSSGLNCCLSHQGTVVPGLRGG